MSDVDDAAQRFDLLRRRVVNVVGHELRTPVTTIRGLADLLVDADLETIRREVGPALVRNARRTEELLDDLLVASGVVTAAEVRPEQRTRVRDLLSVATEAIDAVTIVSPADPAVLAHAGQLSRALRHIVSNAVDYRRSDTALVTVSADEDTVTIVIRSDADGSRVDPELSFELFFRGEVAVTTAHGLGIGLPVARATIEAHGGTVVMLASAEEVTVSVRLPRAPETVSP